MGFPPWSPAIQAGAQRKRALQPKQAAKPAVKVKPSRRAAPKAAQPAAVN